MTNPYQSNLNPVTVASWLREHPDFFVKHPKILDELEFPSDDGSTVSLAHFHLTDLRKRHHLNDQRLTELTGNARHNEAIFGSCRSFIIAILDLTNLDELLQNLETILCGAFNLSAARVISEHLPAGAIARPMDMDYLFRDRSVFLGSLRSGESEQLFGTALNIQSAAVAPLRHGTHSLGHLALGDISPTRFERGQGTLFVSFVADAITRVISHHQPALTVGAPGAQPAS